MDNNVQLGTFTEKEIFEIPNVLAKVLKDKEPVEKIAKEIINRKLKHLYLIGAGSPYHAGFALSYMFNKIARIPTYTEYSMEFQHLREPILYKEDCIVAISQSGETKDTIESATIGKKKDA